jgi:histidyl-tRNA synthetase
MKNAHDKKAVVSPFFKSIDDLKRKYKETPNSDIHLKKEFLVEISKVCKKYGYKHFSIGAIDEADHLTYGEGQFGKLKENGKK